MPRALCAKDKACFFPKLANGGDTECGGNIARAALGETCCTGGVKALGERDIKVITVQCSAWKDEFVGHEGGLFTALAHQHFGRCEAVAQGNHRCGIADGCLVDWFCHLALKRARV